MKGKTASLFLVLVLAFAGCNSDKSAPSAGLKENSTECLTTNNILPQLDGTWKWIETAYFSKQYGQLTKTPQNTGKKLTYTFTDDTLIITLDGKVVDEIRYEIGALKDLTHFPQDNTPIIRLFNGDEQQKVSLLHLCGDEIVLVNSYNSMGGNVKLRKNG
ncbi:MAG: hypothetical protein JXR41_15535 [Bacteroidales bacterium]|nr:hypothetical protein [Bacteroidales bacterium]